ncbi:AAA domain-containing protein [Hirsutella rhossiliensis]|uniref:AAA domain-containing protein n=1 Tax=Hirsutella rhossiliensis TaxID=111463 RepID=A0A9P8MPT6_9HYPO|nr:AAA domain-containing protein [Hirsutella rhossiliensis]KAH0957971.1 AAA domain-containing protein [Hirsutella rhossiliensis]
MAPLKRTRHVIDNDDDVDNGGEQAEGQDGRTSPVGGAQSRKRVRLSLEGQSSHHHDDSSSSEDEDDEKNGPNSPPLTQYEIMRDNGFKHLQNTDMDDLRATQKLQRRPSSLGDNMVAESGIIESVTCINFMCHERLHVELGPLINFIVGENGSGKSAVLTALTLCLGGKASDTNRGGSLKSFVKEGQDHGRLIVKIKNAGSDAYQHDVYGDSIIVERHFSKSGSSGFKIKSDHEQIISTKKQEVDEISEWYALQMGNPLTVLSQDNARQFLNSATPTQKYKYFVSGVQLEQLDNDYKMSQDTLDKTLILRDDLNEKIGHVKKEMEDAQRLAETVQKNNSLREKARHYRNQLVWSQVVEQEQALERRQLDLSTRDQRITETEAECEEMSKALLECQEKMDRATANRNSLDEEKEFMAKRIAAAEASFQTAKKDLTELHREERDAFSRLKTARGEIEACEGKILEEEQRLNESTGSAHAEKDAELSEATSQERNINEQISAQNEQLPMLQSTLAEAEHVLKKKQELRDSKRNDILTAEAGVRELEKSTGSAYDGFDREMMNLVKAVSNSGGFEHKPLGPLGAHIRLVKPEWSGVLEKTLGETLNAFVVRSKRDQTRLSGLIRQNAMRKPPPIYIAYGGPIDTRDQEPDSKFDTILRVLEFDEELVRSQLVINNQIEKVILVMKRLEAEQIMIDSGPPRNVAACICFHDGQGKRGQGLRITNRSGTIATSPIIPGVLRPRMQSDSARQLALQKENLKHLGLELRELMSEERLAQQAVQGSQSELETHRRRQTQLANDLRRTQADIERIQTELDAFEGVDDRLVVLRSELETKRAEEEQLGIQYGNMKLTKRGLSARAEEAKKRLDTERDHGNNLESRKNDAFERLDIERAERRRAEQAEAVAPGRVYIPEGEDHRSIEKKYEKIGEQLAQREARIGATDQEIYDRANEARGKYEGVVKQTRHVDETIASLKHAIEHRLHLWRQFQRQISARVRIQFNYLLSERGFRGKIDLDHRARKVIIHVEPDETRKSSAGRNTKTLSGGEKSFSSICMLLSVWEAIGSPIRCLDEFDVFMDNVNRAISTNMLVDAARRSVSRQYILITPNAIEGRARLDKDVKIIRLTDPRQRTLV